MNPSEDIANELVTVLKEKKIGVVAHYYMDPEVQGVLTKVCLQSCVAVLETDHRLIQLVVDYQDKS